jgi:hypothetical protein
MLKFWRSKQTKIESLMGRLTPESVVSIATAGLDGSLKIVPVDFVFVLISAKSPEAYASLAGMAIQIALSYQAIVVANAGGLLQLAVGPRAGIPDCTEYRRALALAISGSLGASAQIVHGRMEAYVGSVGTQNRKTWGYYPVGINHILKDLLFSPPGEPIDKGQG